MKLRSNFSGLDRKSLTLYWRLSPHVWCKFVYGTHTPPHTAAPSGSYGKEKQCGAVKCGINSLVLQSRWSPSNSKVVPAQRAAPWWPKQSENCVLAERGNITFLNFKRQAGSKTNSSSCAVSMAQSPAPGAQGGMQGAPNRAMAQQGAWKNHHLQGRNFKIFQFLFKKDNFPILLISKWK